MTMSDEVRAEYNEMLTRVIIKQGGVVCETYAYYGWEDYDATAHLRGCGAASHGVPSEDTWEEFMGTFYEGDETRHGVAVTVTCACGELVSRAVRVGDRSMQDIAEAIFTELYAAQRAVTFVENQIVRDDEGNHFRVVSVRDAYVRCESVATKELFQVPAEELTLTDLSPR